MTGESSTSQRQIWVVIEVSRTHHEVFIESPPSRRCHFRIANSRKGFVKLAAFLSRMCVGCGIALEARGDYYRPLAHFLREEGFAPHVASSAQLARRNDHLGGSWGKNGSRKAEVILHLLKTGATQTYEDLGETHAQDRRELLNAYLQISKEKARLRRTIVTHFLALYFPEATRHLRSRHADWFLQILFLTPCPAAVRKYSSGEFLAAALALKGRRLKDTRWLARFYQAAKNSIGLPVSETSEVIRMFRMVLTQYMDACCLRHELEEHISTRFANDPSLRRLQAAPGMGPVRASTIPAAPDRPPYGPTGPGRRPAASGQRYIGRPCDRMDGGMHAQLQGLPGVAEQRSLPSSDAQAGGIGPRSGPGLSSDPHDAAAK